VARIWVVSKSSVSLIRMIDTVTEDRFESNIGLISILRAVVIGIFFAAKISSSDST